MGINLLNRTVLALGEVMEGKIYTRLDGFRA
jgi:hypothetical protein